MDLRAVSLVVVALLVCVSLTASSTDIFTKKAGLREGKKSSRHRNKREDMCELEITCRGDPDIEISEDGNEILAPVKLPIRGPRGPPGTAGQKGDNGDDGLPGLPGIPGLSAPVPKKIAFFVGLTNNMGPVTEHTDIVFDQIITNIGHAYDASSGRFTAPVNATYQFNVIVSAQGRQKGNKSNAFGGGKAAVMILKNGQMVATVWAESIPYWATASNIVILSLEKGDQVWLLLLNRASYLHGYMYSTFSGFMIFEN